MGPGCSHIAVVDLHIVAGDSHHNCESEGCQLEWTDRAIGGEKGDGVRSGDKA